MIEYGDEDIRNGRKLQKEDFSYFYEKPGQDRISNASFTNSNIKGLGTDRDDSPNSKIFQ